MILVKRLRKLVVLTSAFSVLLGIFMTYLVATPIYLVDGVVEGYVALTHHELIFYGTPVTYDALSSTGFLSLSILMLNVYLVFAGVSTLYLFFSGKNFNVGVKWLFGGALTLLAFSGLLIALIRLVSTIAAQLNIDLSQVTSAGTLYLGASKVFTAYPTGYLLSPLTVFIVTQAYVVLATATYLHMALIDEYRRARHPPYREIKYRIVGS